MAVGLCAALGCTLLIDSEGLTDRFGEQPSDSSTIDSFTTEVDIDSAVDDTVVMDTADTAIDARPPDPPDTSECTSRTIGAKTYLVCNYSAIGTRAARCACRMATTRSP